MVFICTRSQTFLRPCHCCQIVFSICQDSVTVLCPGQSFLQDTITSTLAEVWTQYISFTVHSEMPQLPSCNLTRGMLSVGDATQSGAVIPNTTHPRIAAATSLSTQNLNLGQSRHLLTSCQLFLLSPRPAHLSTVTPWEWRACGFKLNVN